MDDAFVGEARTAFQILALAATVLSGFLLRRALRARARLKELHQALAPPLRDLSHPGSPVLVSGSTAAGPSGWLHAPYSGTRCVWFRTEEWQHEAIPGRRYEGVQASLVAVRQSQAPFVLEDRTGAVRCYPHGATTDKIALTHDSFAAEGQESLAGPAGGDTDRRRPGRLYREWSLAPGARVVVHGTVYTWDGTPVIASSPDGRLLLSTRTAPQLRDAYGTREFIGWTVFLGALGALLWSFLG